MIALIAHDQKKQAILEELTRERDLLQKKIEELRSFERDYRARLKSYLEGQLRDLDKTGVERSSGDRAKEHSGQQG